MNQSTDRLDHQERTDEGPEEQGEAPAYWGTSGCDRFPGGSGHRASGLEESIVHIHNQLMAGHQGTRQPSYAWCGQ